MGDRHDEHRREAYACVHVFSRERPVLLVNREGGDWIFVCGAAQEDSGYRYRVVGIGHVLEHDAIPLLLNDFSPEREAKRNPVADERSWVPHRSLIT
jgi:hypothetical protein